MRSLKQGMVLSLLVVSLMIGFEKWRILGLALLSDAAYFPRFPFWPFWLPLGFALVSYLIYFILGEALRLSIRLVHSVMAVALAGVVLVVSVLELTMVLPESEWLSESSLTPQTLLTNAAVRLKTEIDHSLKDSFTVIDLTNAEEIGHLLTINGKMPSSGYRCHGLMTPIKLVAVSNADGPVLAGRNEDRAGTIYFAVSEDSSWYWITILAAAALPNGRTQILIGPNNEPLVITPDSSAVIDEDR